MSDIPGSSPYEEGEREPPKDSIRKLHTEANRSPETRVARDALVSSIADLHDGFKLGRSRTQGNWTSKSIPESRGGGDNIQWTKGDRKVTIVYKPEMSKLYESVGFQEGDQGGFASVKEERAEGGDFEQLGFTVFGSGETKMESRSTEQDSSGQRYYKTEPTEDPMVIGEGQRFVEDLAAEMLAPDAPSS